MTLRSLNSVFGGATRDPLEPRPRTYGCPSRNGVGCLPPRSEGCFSEAAGNCTEDM